MSEVRRPPRTIVVAICTFRRSSIESTLVSIATQKLPAGLSIRVIVADNDAVPSARSMVEATAERLDLVCRYVHAPQQNISIARNACLDAATGAYLAFIDDDEVATQGWIASLVDRMDETGADAVLGPARAIYPEAAPAWVPIADLHSTRPPIVETDLIRTGYTCNVLLRLEAFGGRRFDPALGRSGGEDDVFFASAVREGARIAYAPDAVVDDPVPLGRANLKWLMRRSFRSGQTHARNSLAAGSSRLLALTAALAKAGLCMGAATLLFWSAAKWRRLVVRGTLHLGASARYLGWRELQLY